MIRAVCRWLARWIGAIAWVVMAAGVSILFVDEARDDAKDREDGQIALEAARDARDAVQRVEREGLERDYELCTNSNTARAGIMGFLTDLAGRDGQIDADDQAVLDFAETHYFGQTDCPPKPK